MKYVIKITESADMVGYCGPDGPVATLDEAERHDTREVAESLCEDLRACDDVCEVVEIDE